YHQGLKALGKSAAEGIARYRDFIGGERRAFTPDWRLMLNAWRPQTCADDGVAVAVEEQRIWSKLCPAVSEDKSTALQALPAAWIVTMSEDPEHIRAVTPEILAALESFDYDQAHYASLFFTENVVEELLAPSRNL
ncbi:hypothetical protein, partial [Pontiella sp.]|uniref:hypothetical protein n=1 Tax=Pontiella sp. TaxID=2837462 RepID=UPI0035634006